MTTTICTHINPHPDELAVIWAGRRFGEKRFPGFRTARIVYWPYRDRLPDGKTREQLESEGWLFFGIGGGRYDDKATDGTGRKAKSSFTLFVADLGLSSDACLQKIIKYVENNDSKGTTSGLTDLARVVRNLQRYVCPNNLEMVIGYASTTFEAIYRQCVQYAKAAEDFQRAKAVEFRTPITNRQRTLAVCETDNQEFAAYCHGEKKVSVVVCRKSSGNVTVLSNKRQDVDLKQVAVELRRSEAAKRKLDCNRLDLAQEGSVLGWHWQPSGQWVLNGSDSADSEPTRLELDQIEAAIVLHAR